MSRFRKQGRAGLAARVFVLGALTVTAAIAVGGFAGPSLAAAGEDADWPCIQRLVPEISAGMLWAGPPPDQATAQGADPEIIRLATAIARRAMPLADAEKAIDGYAQGLAVDRNAGLTLLFSAVLERINDERSQVIAGIKRYAQRQKQLAQRIESQLAELDTLQGTQDADGVARRAELVEQNAWDSRIYEQREASLTYLCETPVLLEQRAFALARAIAYHLD